MNKKDVLQIYDNEYAKSYTASYLTGKDFIECTNYEVEVLGDLLNDGRSWLDAACGTGYILSQFPSTDRGGFDISPAMLDHARLANPDVPLFEHDYRNDRADWDGKWGLISCMWFAYCYASTLEDIARAFKNFASWLSPSGCLFLPVCEPNVLTKLNIPRKPPADSDDGLLLIDGVIWTWIDQPSGKIHRGLIAPTLEWVHSVLSEYFQSVELIRYPDFTEDCLASRSAFIARKTESQR